MKEKTDWTCDEFRVYLLLYAAHADLDFTQAEKDFILQRTNEPEFRHIQTCFISDNDYERVRTIQSFRDSYFKTDADVEECIKDVFELLNVEHKLSQKEEYFFSMMRRILIG